MSVETTQYGLSPADQGSGSHQEEIAAPGGAQPAICSCGCGKPLPEGRKWATNNCRQVVFNALHPRVDLSGLDTGAAKRAERMMGEAIRAAKLGQARAVVDARSPVTHQRETKPDPRHSNRIRLDDLEWDDLEWLAIFMGLASRTAVVCELIREAVKRAQEFPGKEELGGQDPEENAG